MRCCSFPMACATSGRIEARRDVLRAIPVECVETEHECAFRPAAIAGRRDRLRQLRIIGEALRLGMGENLQPPAVRVIHQDQRDARIGGEIAEADILPIAGEIRERQRPVVDHAQEAARAAAMLDVRPAGLRDARHVEAVAFGDKGHLVVGEAVERAVAFEILPQMRAGILRLRRLDAGRDRDVQKSVRHGRLPPLGTKIASHADLE